MNIFAVTPIQKWSFMAFSLVVTKKKMAYIYNCQTKYAKSRTKLPFFTKFCFDGLPDDLHKSYRHRHIKFSIFSPTKWNLVRQKDILSLTKSIFSPTKWALKNLKNIYEKSKLILISESIIELDFQKDVVPAKNNLFFYGREAYNATKNWEFFLGYATITKECWRKNKDFYFWWENMCANFDVFIGYYE
jgi:hypothetical protein